jgi:hypothetical protein
VLLHLKIPTGSTISGQVSGNVDVIAITIVVTAHAGTQRLSLYSKNFFSEGNQF